MSLGNKEILLIDDNQDILKPARKILEGAGYKIRSETEVSSAAKYLESHVPHAIFLDINFGKGSKESLKFLQEKNKNPSLRRIPTIIFSGEKNKKIIALALASGAKDYIGKPFTAQDLLTKAKRCIHDDGHLSWSQ